MDIKFKPGILESICWGMQGTVIFTIKGNRSSIKLLKQESHKQQSVALLYKAHSKNSNSRATHLCALQGLAA